MSPENHPSDVPVELPINGVLDLHTFRPREIGGLIPDWLAACQERGILELRIIHGKGIGHLQRSVHSILARHPEVLRYSLASAPYGGTGATIVHLRPPPQDKMDRLLLKSPSGKQSARQAAAIVKNALRRVRDEDRR